MPKWIGASETILSNTSVVPLKSGFRNSGSTAIPAVGQPVSGKRRIWIATAVVAIAIGGLIVWWRQPPAVPVVGAVTQLTDDGEIKALSGRLVTDGSRIYFGEGTTGSYWQNYAGRGNGRPDGHHSDPIAEFPIHSIEP